MDVLSSQPNEILCKIFSENGFKGLKELAKVNPRFRNICEDEWFLRRSLEVKYQIIRIRTPCCLMFENEIECSIKDDNPVSVFERRYIFTNPSTYLINFSMNVNYPTGTIISAAFYKNDEKYGSCSSRVYPGFYLSGILTFSEYDIFDVRWIVYRELTNHNQDTIIAKSSNRTLIVEDVLRR